MGKILIGIVVGFLVLFFYAYWSVSNNVHNAETKEELQKACWGLTVQSAPVKCLKIIEE